jgi:choice-of-anchor B domain-containing protein
LGHLEDYTYHSDIWGYTSPEGIELAMVGTFNGTTFVDVTDPRNPVEVAFIGGPGSGWRDIKTYGTHAYIVNESGGGLQIVDLSDPLSPTLVDSQTSFFVTAHNIYIDESAGILYAVGTDVGTVLLNLEEPAAPGLAGSFDDFYIHDIYVRDGVAYAAAIFDGFLATLDVSSPSGIFELDRAVTPGSATHSTWLTDDGRTCVTTDETPSGHLGFFDVSDPTMISFVSEWKNPEQPTSSVHNAFVRGDYVFASWYTAGIQILDITDLENPRRFAFFDTPSSGATFTGTWGAYPFGPESLVYISDTDTGIYILSYEPDFAVVKGVVTDASTNEPIPGAVVSVPADTLRTVTDTDGSYELVLGLGDHEIVYEAFGFETEFRSLSLTLPRERSLNLGLSPLASGSLSGRVESREGSAISGAEITLLETPLFARSGDDGSYVFERVPEGDYSLRVQSFGYVSSASQLDILAGTDAILDIQLSEACFADNLEEDMGWTVGSDEDDATTGIWARVDPVGSGQGFVQPEDDHTPGPGSLAWITGQAEIGGGLGDSDVDHGKTTLNSPLLDLLGAQDPVLVYHRWYVNDAGANPGTDLFLVDASSDGGETWVNVELLGESRPFWERVELPLDLFITPTDRVQLRFVASDFGGGSLIEAGVDDVEVHCRREETRGPENFPSPLLPALPNPSPGPTVLRFQLEETMIVTLDIIDPQGRRVRRFVSGALDPGLHEYAWDGRNAAGQHLAGGVYLQRLRLGDRVETGKLVLTR